MDVDRGSLPRRSTGTRRSFAVAVASLALSLLAPTASAAPMLRDLDTACPPDRVPSVGFYDTNDTTFLREIDCTVAYGLAAGVSQTHFAPRDPVTRAQLASSLAALLDAADHPRPASTPDGFTDDDGSVHEDAIDRLVAEGIVTGFADGSFRPDRTVTRAQTASAVHRALRLLGVPADERPDAFDDDDGSAHEPAIDALADLGIVAGVAPATFGTRGPMSRERTAGFLSRAVDLLVAEGVVPPAYRIPGEPIGAEPQSGMARSR